MLHVKILNPLARAHRPAPSLYMRHTYRELLRYVPVRWSRLQCRISGAYYRRVTFPVQVYIAFGRPREFRPRLPWWRGFVYRWLRSTGWRR